jgi:hypothetical protein
MGVAFAEWTNLDSGGAAVLLFTSCGSLLWVILSKPAPTPTPARGAIDIRHEHGGVGSDTPATATGPWDEALF